jgi:hypothetical protein
MSDNNYEPTDEDILVVMRYLRLNLPEYAVPENAVKLLHFYKGFYDALEKMHPDQVEKILKDLESH